jgi:ATP-dependent protease ClpP protease subunit
MKRAWFEFSAKAADPTVAEVSIFGLIGDWIDDLFGFDVTTTAKSFAEALAKLPDTVKTIRVRINSPGGDAFGGVTIANILRAEQTKGRTVETIVEGLAASAASIVAMGGSVVRMADNALMMVHAPWSAVAGNANEMRAQADLLDQIRDALVKTYQWHSELSAEDIIDLIDGPDGQGTWMSADDAITYGFATEKAEGLKAAASIDPRTMGKLAVPPEFAARVEALLAQDGLDLDAGVRVDPVAPAQETLAASIDTKPEAMTALAVLSSCQDYGLDIAFAQTLMGKTVAEVADLISAETQSRAASATRAADIRATCKMAGQTELAEGYVSSGMTLAAVKTHMATIKAKLDKAEIDAGLKPDATPGHGSRASVIDIASVYAERNKNART